IAIKIAEMCKRKKRIPGELGNVYIEPTLLGKKIIYIDQDIKIFPIPAEQSNTSIAFDEQLILKLYRKLEPGVNPDIEISQYLTEKPGKLTTARVAATLNYYHDRQTIAFGMLQEFIPNEGNAWNYTLDAI